MRNGVGGHLKPFHPLIQLKRLIYSASVISVHCGKFSPAGIRLECDGFADTLLGSCTDIKGDTVFSQDLGDDLDSSFGGVAFAGKVGEVDVF